MIGVWVLWGFCVLLLTGMGKIDTSLYEAARLDGAGWLAELRAVTLPGVRYELGVCLTVTVIAALAAFDIVYVSTGGGRATPRQSRASRSSSPSSSARSAWRRRSPSWSCSSFSLSSSRCSDSRGKAAMNANRGEVYAGRVFLLAMMAFTVLPFISIVHRAAAVGLAAEWPGWPSDPQWDNFAEAFDVANVTTLMKSSMLIVLTVVPISLAISTMAGFGIGLLRIPGARWLLLLFVFGLTLPFEGIITPLYFLARDLYPQHPAGHLASTDRPVHAVRRVLDACPLRCHADGALRSG